MSFSKIGTFSISNLAKHPFGVDTAVYRCLSVGGIYERCIHKHYEETGLLSGRRTLSPNQCPNQFEQLADRGIAFIVCILTEEEIIF